MSSKRYHSILSSSPANQTAARVVSRGIHYDPPEHQRPRGATYDGDLPLIVLVPPDKHDLTGIKVGRLTVVGYLGDAFRPNGRSKWSRWLVRCVCGTYEHRKGHSIRRMVADPDRPQDRCWRCASLEKLKAQGARP